MKKLFAIIFLASFSEIALAQYVPGTSYYGSNNYIQYIAGNIPLVISVPHGGSLAPANIPNRTCPGSVSDMDAYTIELGNELQAAIVNLTGCYPHMIINLLSRKKLDANREIEEAACGNANAEQAWYDFHGFIDDAKQQLLANNAKGLYIDLHGHGHSKQRIELGYLLYSNELQQSDETLNTPTYINFSSIKNLVSSNLLNQTHAELLRGTFSLGTLLENKGYPAVPSTGIPSPLNNDPYYSGGYNTATHSSYNGGTIDGVQMECNQDIRFNSAARKIFADSLARIIVAYMGAHYFVDFATNACATVCADNYEPNNAGNTAASIPLSTNVSGMIGLSTDIDWFKFSNTIAQPNIKITLDNLPADYNLTLTKNGTLATSKKSGLAPESIIWNTATIGTYKLKVNGKSGAFNSAECYRLKVELSTNPWTLKMDDGMTDQTVIDQDDDLLVYPNPANSQVTLQYYGENEISGQLIIMSIFGQVVYSSAIQLLPYQEVQVNTAQLNSGNYFLGIRSNEGKWNVLKIAIMHEY